MLDFIDRCHSLSSLLLPPAALASLPLAVKPGNVNTKDRILSDAVSWYWKHEAVE